MSTALWVMPDELGDMAESEYAYEACKAASFLLWGMSGRKFTGTRSVSERYYLPSRDADWLDTMRVTYSGARLWDESTIAYGSRANPMDRIRLRGTPVTEILSVRSVKDGTVFDPESYVLLSNSTVEFRKPLSAEVEITYNYGFPPPVAGRMAARTMALNFAYLWSGREGDCSFPDRVTNVTRQGVSWVLLDNQDFIAELRTGIYAVDLFLKTVNPDGARAKAKVFTPGRRQPTRVTPKRLPFAKSSHDVVAQISSDNKVEISLTAVGAGFLTAEEGWDTELIVRSWAGKKSQTLQPDNVVVEDGFVILTFPYTEIISTVGTADPGYWDLYGVKAEMSTYIASGNLQISPR